MKIINQPDMERPRKREPNGQYTHQGNLDRECICGHRLGDHAAGSPADCLVYSFSQKDRASMLNGDKPDCGCQRFRPKKSKKGEAR